MGTVTQTLSPGAMPELPKGIAFKCMAKAIIHHLGEVYLTSLLMRTRSEMAKAGFLGWEPEDGNCLFDIVPFGGNNKSAATWAYRVTFAATRSNGGVHIVKYIMPENEVAESRKFGLQLTAG